ncbi:RdgB/HAM1 family non-canonical purine NTP pyrophosphatase [Crenothrix sp.]|uniref:RdgB/HAM1 family non-canonical purine NTP pyrophosphatase n=1 Tax=Crenothrix sp. TaxID=3100433 RepID=UPI00374DE191
MILATQHTIVLASGNQGKVKEFQAILQDNTIRPQSEFGVTECEESGVTFIENALLKARNAALHCQMPAIADDSGLVVDALGGAPGVISARYAGVGASDQDNNTKLLLALKDFPIEQRSARFICVLVYLRHANDPCPIIAQGSWEGHIVDHAAGDNGFGYDPIFWVPEQQYTSAQLPPAVKNALSHRGQALNMLMRLLKTSGL